MHFKISKKSEICIHNRVPIVVILALGKQQKRIVIGPKSRLMLMVRLFSFCCDCPLRRCGWDNCRENSSTECERVEKVWRTPIIRRSMIKNVFTNPPKCEPSKSEIEKTDEGKKWSEFNSNRTGTITATRTCYACTSTTFPITTIQKHT